MQGAMQGAMQGVMQGVMQAAVLVWVTARMERSLSTPPTVTLAMTTLGGNHQLRMTTARMTVLTVTRAVLQMTTAMLWSCCRPQTTTTMTAAITMVTRVRASMRTLVWAPVMAMVTTTWVMTRVER